MAVIASPVTQLIYSGLPAASGTATVYQSGTSTLVTIYSDAACTTPASNPITADDNGQVTFYVLGQYNLRVLLKTSDGTTIDDIDPVYPVPANVKGADIASASTINLAAATGDFVDVTGTTTITSLGAAGTAVEKTVRFTGALTLTHNASSLILPGVANITTAANDVAKFRWLSGSNWQCISYVRSNGEAIITRQGTSLASASTVNIGAATADFFDITGTTTITAFDTVAAGIERTVRFTDALTLTHNATSLKLPGGANITTAADDRAIFRSLGSGNWLCVGYVKSSTAPLQVATQAQQETAIANDVFVSPGRQHYHFSAAKFWVNFNGVGTVAINQAYNVSSITDNGVGDYTVNFTTSFGNTTYTMAVFGSPNGSATTYNTDSSVTVNTGNFRLNTVNSTSGAAKDLTFVSVIGFGDQ